MLLGRKVDAVRIGFEYHAVVFLEFLNQCLQQLAPAPRDFRRQFAVAETRPGESEITVEGVDENLEGGLPGLRLVALGGRGRSLGQLFVFHPVFVQPPQERDEHPEGVALRIAPHLQQQARVKRRHVEVQHVLEHAFAKTAGEPALERRNLDRGRATRPCMVIFLEKQQVHFAGGAAQRRLLQQGWECPGLLEIGGQQHVGQSLGFAQIVRQISQELRPILPECVLYLAPLDIRSTLARFRGDAEVDRRVLQPVGGHFARRDVVELHQQIGVNDRAAGHVTAGKVDPALRHLHAAGAKLGRQAEPAPPAGHPVPPGPGPQVIEVEFEDVVALDDIRINFTQQVIERQ